MLLAESKKIPQPFYIKSKFFFLNEEKFKTLEEERTDALEVAAQENEKRKAQKKG